MHMPFHRRKRPARQSRKTEATPFPTADRLDVQSDDEEFYKSLKIAIRERRVTIVDDKDSDSEGDVTDAEAEYSRAETVDQHNMHFQPRRASTPQPKTIEAEATPSPFENMLDAQSDDKESYEALKKIVIRERRMTIVDSVDSGSEWDAGDEWDEEREGTPTTSRGLERVEDRSCLSGTLMQ